MISKNKKPWATKAFEKLCREAGAPVGAYTNLLISHDRVNAVIDDPRIKGVALTGGVAAATGVAARAGRKLKKSTMELGGSDAFIVLADADLDMSVKWAIWAKMNNTGQCCVAAKRFIIVEKLYARFLEKFQAALATFQPGDPMDKTTTLAPLSTEAALVQLLAQVNRAVANGATVVMGGKRIDRPGSFMQPTILTNNHHLLVAKGGRLKLSSSFAEKIHFARPSAEPLFASVADVYRENAIAVVLTGGDGDGSFGVQIIKEQGGKVIAQDRPTSQDFSMPETSIKTGDVDFILPLTEIAPKLIELVGAAKDKRSAARRYREVEILQPFQRKNPVPIRP